MKTFFLIMLLTTIVWAEGNVIVAAAKRKPDAASAVGGLEITTTAELYSAMPVEAKKSQVVGGLVKSYSGEVDLICAQVSKICVITFKNKK